MATDTLLSALVNEGQVSAQSANAIRGDINAAYRDYTAASRIDPEWNQPRQELSRFRVVSQ